MNTESIILSSSGLRNLRFEISNETENEFNFYFGKHCIKMHRVFADFISPKASHLHNCDPTSNSIRFTESTLQETNLHFDDIFNDEVVTAVEQIAHGYSVKVSKENNRNLRIISILLGNEELFQALSLRDSEIKEASIDEIIKELRIYSLLSKSIDEKTYMNIISRLSKEFYSININQLKILPISMIYMIINNEKFEHEDEDKLLDIINELKSISKGPDQEYLYRIYEEIEFDQLNSNKLRELVEEFDYTQMTGSIWRKLCKCFYFNYQPKINRKRPDDEIECRFNGGNRFNGIINYLMRKYGGDLDTKGIVKATSSTNSYNAKCALELTTDSIFQSTYDINQWIMYDFGNYKIHPTHYSIRTRNDNCNGANPQHWNIEVSNNNQDWKIIDSRNNITSLRKANQSDTFSISQTMKENKSYQYIRLRQTGESTGRSKYLTLTALEFFGILIKNTE